tara:strand:- start:364 stop:3522 length:3159 start_codon:yes stop_codon:yes gene_type:complete
MPLFNDRIIQKHTSNIKQIPGVHLSLINNWVDQIKNGALAKQNEVAIHAPFTNQIIVKLLGYSTFGEDKTWTVAREYGIAGGAVDLALGKFFSDKNKDIVLAPFELKGAKTKDLDAIMPGRHKTPVQQAWEYAKDIKGAKWVLLSNYIELRLYSISETSLVYEKFLFEDLLSPSAYAKFMLLLSPENLLNGKTERILKESQEAEKEISNKLYSDYKSLRDNMISLLIQDNQSHNPEDLIYPTQKLLDRILFIAFAEDKGLIPDTTIKKAFEHADPYNIKPIYQNFIGLFKAIDKGNKALDIPAYNGGLFAADELLDNLSVSDKLCEGFKNLAEYDFDSEVSVTVLGHIFEQSISDLEELTKSITDGDIPTPSKKTSVTGKRKKHGVVYTPDNITQFIVVNTLGVHINNLFDELFSEYGKYKSNEEIQWKKGQKTELRFWYAWQEKLKSIKVVDPACGSGAFLVAAFDHLYLEYEKTNNKIAELTGQRSILDLNKEILNNNLFGVDINEESIEITKLSLWLKTAERGKPLESLKANFISGNSLGFNESAPASSFYWKDAFKDVFDQGGFDVVLGNPPYVRMELLKDIKPWLEKNYAVTSDRMDLYGYFFELGIKLLKKQGRMAFISNATFFKTGSGKKLRNLLSSSVCLEKIIDFGDIQIFDGVTTYPAIIVLKKSSIPDNQKIQLLNIQNSLPDNLHLSFEQLKVFMKQKQLRDNGWQLEDERLFEIRNKIKSDRPTLKEIYGAPLYGIKTGCNDAFVVSQEIRDNIIQKDPKSSGLLKPFLEGKDLKKWHSQSRSLYLINIPKGAIDIEDYPSIKEWLTPFKERLKQRATKQEWFELQQAQLAYQPSFNAPKIQYGHFCPEPLFHYNIDHSYSNDKSYIIPTDDLYLYGLLNSNVYWFLIKSMCPFVRGGYYEVRAQYIETLPIPPKPDGEIISAQAAKIQSLSELRYKCERNFSRRLVDLCPVGETFKLTKKLEQWWKYDFISLQSEIKKSFKGSIPLAERNDWQDFFENQKNKRAELNQEIQTLEERLNLEVYTLFDLTKEEIKLILDN